jgi:hypothetical protein
MLLPFSEGGCALPLLSYLGLVVKEVFPHLALHFGPEPSET